MKRYTLSMARFFRCYHTALALLDEEEYAVLAFMALSRKAERHDEYYSSIAYL